MTSPAERELAQVSVDCLLEETLNSWLVLSCCERRPVYSLEKQWRRFSGIPEERIRYADAVDLVKTLAHYKQKANKNVKLRQMAPSTN